MNTRVLVIIALIIAGIAGWFFQQQGDVAPPVSMAPTDVDYEATEIKAVQTNDEGETEYELTAESLTHNPETNLDEMSGIIMNWEPSAEQRYRIEAGTAAISQETGELSLSGGFSLVSEGNKDASEVEPIKVTGSTLKGNTKSGKVYSDEPVQVVQGMNRFEASSMTANLETGEYEFGHVAVAFTPSERQDKALF
ncbi:LPS export ABC transporter periplasmic protein LptC [Psychrobacter sp. NZS113]|uniref:LPS export ABC transporter periplasmic protein LptC n=1 Tax=unclassified Psychrobacter TaxID=196806 RepID=UPI0018842287|nr:MULTISPECIES: LPS export ABC transporter periplasmic protein LptC [unclassified Psychrobacter]MBF0658013.1 LPS export ABC transporter periplasmic protein LptC [Psychrobacter sp. NG25]MBH0095666.1 LPS export ABC transporter periplasmic protein LptC [Psychrobacter sp. NZS113]